MLESYSKSYLSIGSRISLSSWTSCLLPQRALVKVQGVEAAPFLQGLITNDINPLVEDDRKRFCKESSMSYSILCFFQLILCLSEYWRQSPL